MTCCGNEEGAGSARARGGGVSGDGRAMAAGAGGLVFDLLSYLGHLGVSFNISL